MPLKWDLSGDYKDARSLNTINSGVVNSILDLVDSSKKSSNLEGGKVCAKLLRNRNLLGVKWSGTNSISNSFLVGNKTCRISILKKRSGADNAGTVTVTALGPADKTGTARWIDIEDIADFSSNLDSEIALKSADSTNSSAFQPKLPTRVGSSVTAENNIKAGTNNLSMTRTGMSDDSIEFVAEEDELNDSNNSATGLNTSMVYNDSTNISQLQIPRRNVIISSQQGVKSLSRTPTVVNMGDVLKEVFTAEQNNLQNSQNFKLKNFRCRLEASDGQEMDFKDLKTPVQIQRFFSKTVSLDGYKNSPENLFTALLLRNSAYFSTWKRQGSFVGAITSDVTMGDDSYKISIYHNSNGTLLEKGVKVPDQKNGAVTIFKVVGIKPNQQQTEIFENYKFATALIQKLRVIQQEKSSKTDSKDQEVFRAIGYDLEKVNNHLANLARAVAEARAKAEAQRLSDLQKKAEAQRLSDLQKKAEAQRLSDLQKKAEAQRLSDLQKADTKDGTKLDNENKIKPSDIEEQITSNTRSSIAVTGSNNSAIIQIASDNERKSDAEIVANNNMVSTTIPSVILDLLENNVNDISGISTTPDTDLVDVNEDVSRGMKGLLTKSSTLSSIVPSKAVNTAAGNNKMSSQKTLSRSNTLPSTNTVDSRRGVNINQILQEQQAVKEIVQQATEEVQNILEIKQDQDDLNLSNASNNLDISILPTSNQHVNLTPEKQSIKPFAHHVSNVFDTPNDLNAFDTDLEDESNSDVSIYGTYNNGDNKNKSFRRDSIICTPLADNSKVKTKASSNSTVNSNVTADNIDNKIVNATTLLNDKKLPTLNDDQLDDELNGTNKEIAVITNSNTNLRVSTPPVISTVGYVASGNSSRNISPTSSFVENGNTNDRVTPVQIVNVPIVHGSNGTNEDVTSGKLTPSSSTTHNNDTDELPESDDESTDLTHSGSKKNKDQMLISTNHTNSPTHENNIPNVVSTENGMQLSLITYSGSPHNVGTSTSNDRSVVRSPVDHIYQSQTGNNDTINSNEVNTGNVAFNGTNSTPVSNGTNTAEQHDATRMLPSGVFVGMTPFLLDVVKTELNEQNVQCKLNFDPPVEFDDTSTQVDTSNIEVRIIDDSSVDQEQRNQQLQVSNINSNASPFINTLLLTPNIPGPNQSSIKFCTDASYSDMSSSNISSVSSLNYSDMPSNTNNLSLPRGDNLSQINTPHNQGYQVNKITDGGELRSINVNYDPTNKSIRNIVDNLLSTQLDQSHNEVTLPRDNFATSRPIGNSTIPRSIQEKQELTASDKGIALQWRDLAKEALQQRNKMDDLSAIALNAEWKKDTTAIPVLISKEKLPSTSTKEPDAVKLVNTTLYKPVYISNDSIWGRVESERRNDLKVVQGVYGRKNVEGLQDDISEKDAIEKTLLDIIYVVAKKQGLELKDAFDIIKDARDKGGINNKWEDEQGKYSRRGGQEYDGEDNFKTAKKFSRAFQLECENCGILSGRGKSSVGLRTSFIPETVIDKLNDVVEHNLSDGVFEPTAESKQNLKNRKEARDSQVARSNNATIKQQ